MEYFWTYETELPTNLGYSLYGTEHISYILLCLLIIVFMLLVYKNIRKIKTKERVRKTAATISFFLIIIRIVYLLIIDRMSVYELPLHLCSISGILCFVEAYMCKKRGKADEMIRKILYTLCLPGLICAIVFPNGNMYPAISFISIQSYLFHSVTILYIVLLLKEGYVKPEPVNVLVSILFLVVLIPLIYLINLKMGTNYIFIMTPSLGSPLMLLYDGVSYIKYLIRYFLLVFIIMAVMNIPGYFFYYFWKKESLNRDVSEEKSITSYLK